MLLLSHMLRGGLQTLLRSFDEPSFGVTARGSRTNKTLDGTLDFPCDVRQYESHHAKKCQVTGNIRCVMKKK